MASDIKPEDVKALKALLSANPFPKSTKPLIAEYLNDDEETRVVVIREEGSGTPKYMMPEGDYFALRAQGASIVEGPLNPYREITEPTPYVTRRSHGKHPAGSRCIAHRENFGRVLVLTFEDGERVEVDAGYALAGIERPLALVEAMDLEVMAALDAAAKVSDGLP